MSGETNRLIALARDVQPNPDPRELDVVASTGEQVTIGLLAMALKEAGLKAKSYTGPQVHVLTDSAFTKARIIEIDEKKIRADLSQGTVVVVAADGFVAEPASVAVARTGWLAHSVGSAPLPDTAGGPFRWLLPPGTVSPCANVKAVIRVVIRPPGAVAR
jgi:hypothetical protein